MNKRATLSIFLLSIFFLSAAFVQAQVNKPAREDQVAVTLVNQEPDPVAPGRYVDVRFKFDNNGSGAAENIEVEILPDYPFSLFPGESAVRNIGTLQARQKGDVGVIVKYRLRVDKDAIEGENDLRIRYSVKGAAWVEPEEFKIDVRTQDAILSIDSVKMSKDMIGPGEEGILSIHLSNRADSILRDIKAVLGVSGVPLVPIGSSNEQSTYQIDRLGSYEFKFRVLAEPEAASGVYKVPLKITYSDTVGNTFLKNGTIGVIIGAAPDLSVTLDGTEVFGAGKTGEVTVKVVNKGVTDIKFMNLKLLDKGSFDLISNNEVYLGNIDSDDFETASFNIHVGKTKEDFVMLPVQVEYMDANNNKFNEIIDLRMNLYSASEAKKFGLVQGSSFVGNLIILIIVGAGIFFYRRYRKKKKKKA